MPVHLIQPLFKHPSAPPCTLPASIRERLVDPEMPAEFAESNRPAARTPRELFLASGITRKELHARIAWSNNPSKGYRFLDASLNGTMFMEPFFLKLCEALGLSAERAGEILDEDRAHMARRWNARVRLNAHNSYRSIGPYLYAMPRRRWTPSLISLTGDARLYMRVPLADPSPASFEPLSASAVGNAIRRDAPWLLRYPEECVGAYFYHRLPEEVHIFGREGEVLVSGDSLVVYPAGVKRFIW